jgi:hypothetical protein
VRRPTDLARLHTLIDAWRPRVRAATLLAQAALAIVLVIALGT